MRNHCSSCTFDRTACDEAGASSPCRSAVCGMLVVGYKRMYMWVSLSSAAGGVAHVTLVT
jgi:hypothetical protein